MKFILYTVCISPHQLPFMHRIANALPEGDYRYIYTDALENGRKQLGWTEKAETWLFYKNDSWNDNQFQLENCEVLFSGIRDFDLFEKRLKKGLVTIYCSERWFKPVLWGKIEIPGILKLLHPGYLKMALRFRRLLKNENNKFYYFPISMNAARDIALLCSGSSKIDFERIPGGRVKSPEMSVWKNNLRLWGYFVEKSRLDRKTQNIMRRIQRKELFEKKRPLRILWVGRMLALKNVDRIIEAFRISVQKLGQEKMSLTLVGDGEEKEKLLKLSEGLPIEFKPFVPIDEVRQIMQEHDLYIFASNSFDGWGAVVSEAIEEEMWVLASQESGVGSTVLPAESVFSYKDTKRLAAQISNYMELPVLIPDTWSAESAANYFLNNFLLPTEKKEDICDTCYCKC